MSRPTEPNSTSEHPEIWAEIAEWEAQRADDAEAQVSELRDELEELQTKLDAMEADVRSAVDSLRDALGHA